MWDDTYIEYITKLPNDILIDTNFLRTKLDRQFSGNAKQKWEKKRINKLFDLQVNEFIC